VAVTVADIVLWSPDASVYVIVADRKLDIYSVEVGYYSMKLVRTVRI